MVGFDDVITGPIDEIVVLGALTIIGAVSIYNSDANKNFAEALKELFTYNLNRIKSFFAKDEKNSEAKTVENQSPITDEEVKSGKEAEKQSLPGMKKNPPAHPDYEPPKKWDGQKVKKPNGKGSGWPAKNGDVWYQKIIKVHSLLIGMFNIKMVPIHLFIRNKDEIV